MMAARFIVDVQSVISREKDPTEFGIISIGAVNSRQCRAGNIIPDDAVVLGTVRSFKPEVRAKMLAGIERTAKAVAAMSDAPAPDISLHELAYAGKRGAKKAASLRTDTTTSKDSEFAGAGVPSMMFNIGVYERGNGPPPTRTEPPLPATIRRCSRRCRSRPCRPASLP